MEFYDEIANCYDEMTRFQDRLTQARATLLAWRQRYGFTTALDVACGTGLHAIALAQLSIPTIGVDLSTAMLAKARTHALEFGVQIQWVQAAMQQLSQHISRPVHAIFCLGNSLPHLLEPADLDAALQNFHALLQPGGIVVLQLLNYQRMLMEQQRIGGIHKQGDMVYIRFYDLDPDPFTFHILSVHLQEGACPHALHSTRLKPYLKDEITQALVRHGFSQIESYGDMQFHPFEEPHSPNLVLVGKTGRAC